jgi:hypothetical protein
VQAKASPDRSQAPEDLVAGDAISPVHPFGLRRRQEEREVVACEVIEIGPEQYVNA